MKRFKWVESKPSGSHDGSIEANFKNSEQKDQLLPQPILKLAFPNSLDEFDRPAQKPTIPLLTIPPKILNKEKDDRVRSIDLPMQENKVPGIKGIALDVSKVSRNENFDESDYSSDNDRMFDSPNPVAPKGMGLDLSKAKAIQNQMLNQSDRTTKPMFNLALPGVNQADKKMPSLALPVSSGSSNSNEGEFSGRILESPFEKSMEQSTGPQLKINIKNIAKLKDDVEMNKEEEDFEPPRIKRGRGQPDEPIEEAITYGTEEDSQDFMMKNTSVVEMRNNKFKQICSEIIPDFLYLGSDYLAKDKNILLEHGI